MDLRIIKLEQTCNACPSQWEAKLDDGRMLYIRYRWGALEVSISAQPTDNVYDAVDGSFIYNEQIGDNFDGVIDWDSVLEHLAKANILIIS